MQTPLRRRSINAVPAVRDKMETLQRVGVGYIKVDQQVRLIEKTPARLGPGSYRISSVMAASIPSRVSGYMRLPMICWMSFKDGVLFQ